MFGIFKTIQKGPSKNIARESIANTIVSESLRLQERWAALLQRITEKLSIRTKKWVTILFCLLAAGYNLLTIFKSFSAEKGKLFNVTKIKTPQQVTQSCEENIRPVTIIPEKEYGKIIQFRKYMDSLHQSKDGSRKADSILQKRPGLMDSVIRIEQLYHLQQSSKK